MLKVEIGDLVRCHFTGKVGITVRKTPSWVPTKPLTRFYVEWFSNEATWVSAMNLREVVCK